MKRMETVDEEFLAAAAEFIKKSDNVGQPFFCWFNTTHMTFRTRIKEQDRGRAGRWQSEYHDVMLHHDECVGKLLALLDELGIADNTIVMYSTDNGPHMNSWPDHLRGLDVRPHFPAHPGAKSGGRVPCYL